MRHTSFIVIVTVSGVNCSDVLRVGHAEHNLVELCAV